MTRSHNHALLTPFRGTLKQFALDKCSEPLQALFAALFPRFFDQLPWEWTDERKRLFEGASNVVFAPPRNPRRYGGYSLPRSRYYSVCQDADGDDAGTLIHELRAYRDPARTGMVEILDLGLGSSGLLVDGRPVRRFERSPEFVVIIHDPDRLQQQLQGLPTEDVAGPDGQLLRLVRFPYTLRQVTLDATVDLRVPTTRVRFFEQFSKPNEDWLWPEQIPADRLGGVPSLFKPQRRAC